MLKSTSASEEKNRREVVLARLERLAERIGGRNQDLTVEAADALADQFTREVISDMIAEGKIQYGLS
jgi:hypothetical protein